MVVPASTSDQQVRAGDHAGVQRLFTSPPRHLLEEQLPRRRSSRPTDRDVDTHDQERFVSPIDNCSLSQLDQPTQHRPVAGHRPGAEVR